MDTKDTNTATHMTILEAIAQRRSIRQFKVTPVPDIIVEQILSAAQCAPSACNEQPWHFVVVTEPTILNDLAARHPFAEPVRNAPLCVIPCADLEMVTVTLSGGDFWAQGMAAATQNLLLAASALGLGAVWIGTYPDQPRVDSVRDVIGAPDHVVPFCLIAVGYPAEIPTARPASTLNRVHRNRW